MEFSSSIFQMLQLAFVVSIGIGCPVNAHLYLPSSPTAISNLELSDKAISKFVKTENEVRPIGNLVDNVVISNFADPVMDKRSIGTPIFWKGLFAGGCGYGNQLDQNKYPYLMLASVSRTALQQLGFGPEHGVACGACVEITRTESARSKIIAMIGDVIPPQDALTGRPEVDVFFGAWNLQRSSAPPSGSVRRVMCPNPGTDIWMMVKENWGPRMFFKAVFQNVGQYGVLTRVDMACTDGNEWETVSLENTYGAVFQTNNQPRFSSCQFHLHQEDGSKVTSNGYKKLGTGKQDDFPFVQQLDLGVQFSST